MALNHWTEPQKKNKFCKWSDLTNESSVEDFFILPLLKDLGFTNEDIRSKQSIDEISVSKHGGRKKEPFKPDFVLVLKDAPRIVIDAKATNIDISEFEYQCRGYCLSLNLKYKQEKPVQYFVLSNGRVTSLYKWDEETPLLTLDFADFADGNPKYEELKNIISKKVLLQGISTKSIPQGIFEFSRPNIKDLEGIFTACHNLIWKKEKSDLLKHFTNSPK